MTGNQTGGRGIRTLTRQFLFCLLGLASLGSTHNFLMAAQMGEMDDVIQTMYLYTDYGLGTYKSELMETNDTNGIVTYGTGIYAGENRTLGVDYRVESATTAFSLNTSSLQMIWSTTAIRYRFWLLEVGPVFSSITAKGNKEGADVFEAVGSGYGGYFGMTIPVGRKSTIDLKVTQASTGEAIDKKQAVVAFGARMDVEISSRIAITKKALDACVGYRRRTNSISLDGTAYNELQTSTFVGIMGGFDF